MRELDPDLLALGMGKLDNALQRRDLAVFPQPRVFGCDTASGQDGGGFDEGEARPALDDATKVREVPVREVAVVGGVLAQRGEEDAVLEG